MDFDKNCIEISNNLRYNSKDGVYEITPKTEESVRFIKMPVQTMDLLRMWKKQCDMLRITNAEIWNNTGYVLIQDNGVRFIHNPFPADLRVSVSATICRRFPCTSCATHPLPF